MDKDESPAKPIGPASRHYQRAQQDRGAETRTRLILSALDTFGRRGFDGASTRDIAKRADANLAAIVYHFGSKEALHRAVAEHVVEALKTRLGPTLASVERRLAEGPVDAVLARALLQDIVEAHIVTMLGDSEAEHWARFIMREQMEPTASFDVIAHFMLGAHGALRRLIGILLGIDPASDEASLRVYALTGQIVIFRVAHPMVMRTLGRHSLDDADRAAIARIVTEHIDRIVGVPVGAR